MAELSFAVTVCSIFPILSLLSLESVIVRSPPATTSILASPLSVKVLPLRSRVAFLSNLRGAVAVEKSISFVSFIVPEQTSIAF